MESLATQPQPSKRMCPGQLPSSFMIPTDTSSVRGHVSGAVKRAADIGLPVKTSAKGSQKFPMQTYKKAMPMDYNSSYEKKYMGANPDAAKGILPKERAETPASLTHLKSVYGEAGVDLSTVSAQSNLNLDLRNMTQEDRRKVYEFIGPRNARLPIIEAVQLAKVMTIDMAADMKDKSGPSPVVYDENSKWVKYAAPTGSAKSAPKNSPKQAVSPWAQTAAQPEKPKSLLEKTTSAVGGALKKLKFW